MVFEFGQIAKEESPDLMQVKAHADGGLVRTTETRFVGAQILYISKVFKS